MSDFGENISLDFGDLHYNNVSEDLQELVTEDILASGVYDAKGLEISAYMDVANEREMGSVQYGILSPNGKVMKKVRLKASWDKRYKNGRIDKPFRMYKSLITAVGSESNVPGEVFLTAKEVPVRLAVTEAYITSEDNVHEMHADQTANKDGQVWAIMPAVTEENEEEVKSARLFYVGLGLDPIHFVANVYAAK